MFPFRRTVHCVRALLTYIHVNADVLRPRVADPNAPQSTAAMQSALLGPHVQLNDTIITTIPSPPEELPEVEDEPEPVEAGVVPALRRVQF